MSASTIALADHSSADSTFTLAGATANGALYKDATRSLALPLSLQFAYNLGNPGSKSNDKLVTTIRNSAAHSTTGVVSTASIKVEISIPRDDDAHPAGSAEDLMAFVADLLGHSTWRTEIADGIVPSTEV